MSPSLTSDFRTKPLASIVVRRAESDDAGRGLLEVLDQLSAAGVGGLSVERGRELIAEMEGRGVEHLWVALRGERVVGAATLVVEQKLIHGGRRAGRIEDVVVDRRVPLACQCFVVGPLLFPSRIVLDDALECGMMGCGSSPRSGGLRVPGPPPELFESAADGGR